MLFHTPNFLIFMVLLLLPFYLWRKGRIGLLAVANIVFYGAGGLGMLLLFMAVTTATFVCIRLMRRRGSGWLFWAGVAVNVGNLAFFKYALMLLGTAEALLGFPLSVTPLVTKWLTAESGEILMITGISFYTFQLLSYLIDVRRGAIEPTSSLVRFWVYVALFPQLIAGPIMRGGELMPQIEDLPDKRVRWEDIRFGIQLIFIGLIKKVILADSLDNIVAPLFAESPSLTPEQAWIAAYLFGFQIYFDFSAYSDMAMGLGRMIGIRMVLNFDTPYLSASPSEFWKRWHISLSRWIRDYIYIGLGGNRKGALRTHVNLMAAMLISGLWHGAMWHFVAWGAVHGALLIVHKWTLKLNRFGLVERMRSRLWYRMLAIAAFFHIVAWTWVFFRAESIGAALDMTQKMVRADPAALFSHALMPLVAGLFALHIFEYAIRHHEALSARIWHFVPAPLRGAVYAALVFVVFYFMKGETYEFIYFQF